MASCAARTRRENKFCSATEQRKGTNPNEDCRDHGHRQLPAGNQDNYCAQQLAGGTAWGIVCDGMGGVNGGRIAARIATDTMQQYFARHMKALQPGMEKTFIMRGST